MAVSSFSWLSDNWHGLRDYSLKIEKERSWLYVKEYSFSQRVFNDWNLLLQQVVDAKTVNGTKNAVDECWNGRLAGLLMKSYRHASSIPTGVHQHLYERRNKK